MHFDYSNSVYLLHLSSNKHKCFIYYLLRTHLSIRSINMSNSSGSSGSEQEVDATPFHLKKNQNASNKGIHRIITMIMELCISQFHKTCIVSKLGF